MLTSNQLKEIKERESKANNIQGQSSFDISFNRAGFINSVYQDIPLLIEALEKAVETINTMRDCLSFYASPRRCTQGPGWQQRWDYVDIKHESDYEFYPNHDTALEGLESADKFLKQFEDNNEPK